MQKFACLIYNVHLYGSDEIPYCLMLFYAVFLLGDDIHHNWILDAQDQVVYTMKALLDVGFLKCCIKYQHIHIYKISSIYQDYQPKRLPFSTDLPSSLHKFMTALNVLTEKSAVQSTYRRSGSCILKVLCMGVKWTIASAVRLYWSSVHRVLSSHIFFSGHHIAWSDQSIAISENIKISSYNSETDFILLFNIILKYLTWYSTF